MRRKFHTLLKIENELVNRQYVRGRISGIMDVACNVKKHYAVAAFDKGFILTCECTPKQYEKFSKIIENEYPGLCVFDYKMD